MAVQTTSTLSGSIIDVYKSQYLLGNEFMKLYDQFAVDYTALGADGKSMEELMASSSIYVPFLGDMNPGTSAISQTADVTPQTVRDATASVSWVSRGEALQWPKQLTIQTYTDYTAAAYNKIGKNAMESIDLLAQGVALKGSWVERATTRANIDAGTASHRASDSLFRKYDGMFQMLQVPGYSDGGEQVWQAAMHPFCFHDIAESGNMDVIGQYLDSAIHLRWELGQIGRFRLLSSPYAKVFGAAGADNGSGNVSDTLASAANQLATSCTTSSDDSANASYGLFWWLGIEESSSTHYATNEPVKVLSISGTTITLMGRAPNGGLRFDHAATTTQVRNADSVYTILFGGPESLVRVYATDVGPYGETIGPKVSGLLDQFNSLGWRYWGNYGLISQNRLMRYECSTSYEA